MDTSTYEILKECNSGCRMALNSIEQLAVYLKSQELQDLFCKYKEDYEKMEEDGYSVNDTEIPEIVTEMDKIKIQLVTNICNSRRCCDDPWIA